MSHGSTFVIPDLIRDPVLHPPLDSRFRWNDGNEEIS